VYLLDVNILIALLDPFHVEHEKVNGWFASAKASGWATCPITENGFVRIVGNVNYPGGVGSTGTARELLSLLAEDTDHTFWADDISLLNIQEYPVVPGSKALTDYYLLSLAVKNGGYLATLDRRINPEAVAGGVFAYLRVGD